MGYGLVIVVVYVCFLSLEICVSVLHCRLLGRGDASSTGTKILLYHAAVLIRISCHILQVVTPVAPLSQQVLVFYFVFVYFEIGKHDSFLICMCF